MTPRSIRRAAERKAKKLERKKERALALSAAPETHPVSVACADSIDLSFDPASVDVSSDPLSIDLSSAPIEVAQARLSHDTISEARLAANRANAQRSCGPKSSEGKAKVSLNAVKTALTGHTVLLPTDDAAAYQRLLQAYEKDFRPVTQRECDLVQSIADTMWRLRRIPGLEMGIYVKGRIELAESFPEHQASHRANMMETEIFLKYEKQLRNLQLQEARLRRRYEKETAEIRQLQEERIRRERQDLDVAAKMYLKARHDGKSFDPAEVGFEFSIEAVKEYLEGVRAATIYNATLKKDRMQTQAA